MRATIFLTQAAETIAGGKPVGRIAAAIIVLVWLALLALAAVWIWRTFFSLRIPA